MRYTWFWVVLLSLVTASALLSVGHAQDLSGKRGKMRAMGDYPREGCGRLFDRYIAAPGHSAYATTATGMDSGAVCGIALNRKSTKQAEKDAVKACEDGNGRFEVEQLGGCYVGASK